MSQQQAERLYAQHEGFAHFYVRNGLFFPPPGTDWSDLHQQARLALWDAAQGWDPHREAAFPAFAAAVLFRQLSRWVRDHDRSHRRYERAVGLAIEEWETALETWREPDIDGQMRMGIVFRRLKPKQRAALFLHACCDYTSGDLARRCGLTPKQADNLLAYALRAARREAEALDAPPPPPAPPKPPSGRRCLTPAEVAEIRAATGGRGLQRRLAERYGVDPSVISRARKGGAVAG